MTEEAARAAVLTEAATWLRTKFHDCAGIKGVGTDCARMPYAVYRAVQLVPKLAIPDYSPQFLLHSSREIYLDIVLSVCVEVEEPNPGDFVLWRIGRCFSHGAIVMAWPRIIHAWKPAGIVLEDDALANAGLSQDRNGGQRPRRFFSLADWTMVHA